MDLDEVHDKTYIKEGILRTIILMRDDALYTKEDAIKRLLKLVKYIDESTEDITEDIKPFS